MTISGRIEELNRAAEEIEQKLDELPEGTLLLEKERIRWKLPGNRRVTLSTQNDFVLIAALAEKSYLQKVLNFIKQEQNAWDGYWKNMPPYPFEKIYDKLPEKRRAWTVPYQPNGEKRQVWEKASFRTNHKYEEEKKQRCSNGLLVRSKSERMIAERLLYYQLPFRYECGLCLDDYRWVYPDFTIVNSQTGQEVYWEHFGMVDENGYRRNMTKKLLAYQKSGYTLKRTLIMTYESSENPLTQDLVDQAIQLYFFDGT